MFFFSGQLGEVAFALLITVLAATGALVLLAIGRRWQRTAYYQQLDQMRNIYRAIIDQLVNNKLGYAEALAALHAIATRDRMTIFEPLCLERKPSPAARPLIRQLCEDLGLVTIWQRRLSQQTNAVPFRALFTHPKAVLLRLSHLGFLDRAKSAESLGIICHQPSWPLLVAALEDPHPDVQQVAERALGAIGEPRSFGALVRRLHRATLDPVARVSARSAKGTLAGFPLQLAGELIPSLQHQYPQVRLLATEVVQQMVRHQTQQSPGLALESDDLGPELFELFLTTLCFDQSHEVRAHSVAVIAHLRGPRATAALFTLLNDEQWTVRWHAVRALAHRQCLFQLTEIARRLSDSHWMVRQAAVKTLCTFGAPGLGEIFDYFLSTQDESVRNQIAEELQRAGLIPIMLERYDAQADARAARLLGQLVQMGKTRCLLGVLANRAGDQLRSQFQRDFAHLGDQEFQARLNALLPSSPAAHPRPADECVSSLKAA